MYIKGEDLKSMRLFARKSAAAMSEITGVKSRKTIENWEKNKGVPSINQFIAMCEGCGFNSANIIREAVERNGAPIELDLEESIYWYK